MSSNYVNETPIDYHLAKIYFALLIDVAQKRQRITYGDLVDLAQATHLDDAVVQNAIAVSTGRRLEIIQRYVAAQNLPDITSLVYNKNTDECGDGIGHRQPELLRKAVHEFDWSAVSDAFDQQMQQYLEQSPVKSKPVPARKSSQPMVSLEDATKIMATYYMANKAQLPKSIRQQREQLLALIGAGVPVEDAFEQCSSTD